MKHLVRIGKTLVAALVVAVPAILADPSFAHYIATHPWLAASLPLATALVRAVLTAAQERQANPSASRPQPPSVAGRGQ